MTPAVTVVVPTRNRQAILAATLRSIAAQTVPVEVVVVDEASTDDTPSFLAGMEGDGVRVLRNDEPVGAAAARNRGLAAVDTPWVAFCDDDDLWAPDKIADQLGALAATDVAWCCAGSVMVDESLTIVDHQRALSGDVLDDLLAMNVVPGGGSGVVAATEVVRDLGGFDDTLRNSEDWDLWIRLAARSPVAGVDRPLLAYRMWPGSKSRDLDRMVRAWDAITDRHASLAASRGVRPDRARHRRYLARQEVRNGHRLVAARTFGRLALVDREPRDLPRALAALVAPSLLERAGAERAMQRVPGGWTEEADAWLTPFRSPVVHAGRVR